MRWKQCLYLGVTPNIISALILIDPQHEFDFIPIILEFFIDRNMRSKTVQVKDTVAFFSFDSLLLEKPSYVSEIPLQNFNYLLEAFAVLINRAYVAIGVLKLK